MATKTKDFFIVTFDFALFEKVGIIENGVTGFCDARMQCGEQGLQYRVIFYLNGSRCSAWFYPHELLNLKKVS